MEEHAATVTTVVAATTMATATTATPPASAINDDEKDRTMILKRMRVFAWRHLLQFFLYINTHTQHISKVRETKRRKEQQQHSTALHTQFQTER